MSELKKTVDVTSGLRQYFAANFVRIAAAQALSPIGQTSIQQIVVQDLYKQSGMDGLLLES